MFLDTSGLMCLLDREDNRHLNATKYDRAATNRVSHNYVLVEFIALAIARRAPHVKALQFIEAIRNSPEIEVVWVDQGLHDRSMALLTRRPEGFQNNG